MAIIRFFNWNRIRLTASPFLFIKIRTMLKSGKFFFLTAVFLIPGCTLFQAVQPPSPALSVWQGYTSGRRASLSILALKDQKLSYFISSALAKDLKKITPVKQIQNSFSPYRIDHLRAEELLPDIKYRLVIQDDKGRKIDERVFQTLNLDKREINFAAASCMDDKWSLPEQKQMWESLISRRPEMIFLIGDNVYADKYTPKQELRFFFERYAEAFQTIPLYKTRRLIPVLAVWDDHDYGQNNGGSVFKYKSQMQEMFRGFFFLQPDQKYLFQGEGVSFLLKTKYQNFFFMDTRSFKEESSGFLWGGSQKQWLFRQIKKFKNPSWIINGMQFFGSHHKFESFERHSASKFKSMMKGLGEASSPVVFLSGDRHLSELLKVRIGSYMTYELTTSPIHASVYPKPRDFTLSRRHLKHIPGRINYAMIKSKGEEGRLTAEVLVYGKKPESSAGVRLLYKKNIMIQKNKGK